jgi:hypothetical protein
MLALFKLSNHRQYIAAISTTIKDGVGRKTAIAATFGSTSKSGTADKAVRD